MNGYFLYDADTADRIGPATEAQRKASYTSGNWSGIILIDIDGDVIRDGTWDAQQPGVRRVYVTQF